MTEHPLQRFLVRKRTTFTWLVPLCLLIASYLWGAHNYPAFGAGIGFATLGELMRIWAAGTIHKDDAIATSGPYALVRNPLYFGSFLIAVGYALMSGLGPLAWIIVITLFLLFHLAAILSEEAFLRQKFGAPYEEYLKRVPRLFPRLVPSNNQGGQARFTWEQAVYNREQTTALITAFVAVAFALRFALPSVHLPLSLKN